MADKNRAFTIKNMFVSEGVDDAMAEYLLAKCYELIREAKNPTDKPPRIEVTETLRKYFNLDFSQIEAVMDYAYGKSQNRDKPNDYSVAQYLNERADTMVSLVYDAIKQRYSGSARPDITKMNKAYVLIVEELKALTARNPELQAIEAQAIWQYFDTLKGYDTDIYTYYEPFSQSEDMDVYTNKLDRLCIISNAKQPQYTKTQEQLIADADEAIRIYRNSIQKAQELNEDANRTWFIPEYTFTITANGKLLVNGIEGIMKVNGVRASSLPDMVLSQAKDRPNELFMPDIRGHTKSRMRTSLIETGFTDAIQKLFMPTMDNQKGVFFRPTVSHEIAKAEKIDTKDLDRLLKDAGADTEDYPDEIPF
jgi:hypothetical protein